MSISDRFRKGYKRLVGSERHQPRSSVRREIKESEVFPLTAEQVQRARKEAGQVDPVLAKLLFSQWQEFFDTFRDDELHFELKQYLEQAREVQVQLDALADSLPDALLCRQMGYLLQQFSRERYESRDSRFNEVTRDIRGLRSELEGQKMAAGWMTDEMARCRDMITRALQGREVFMADSSSREDPPLLSELLATLLGVSSKPGRLEVSIGRRQVSDPSGINPCITSIGLRPVDQSEDQSDLAIVRQTLTDLLNKGTTVSRLRRALEDEELAIALVETVARYRRHRSILKRVGLLPGYSAVKEEDELDFSSEEEADELQAGG